MTEAAKPTALETPLDRRVASPGQTPLKVRVVTLGVLAVAVVTLWTFSVPGTYFLVLILLPWIWGIAFGVWLALVAPYSLAKGRRAALRNRWVAAGAAFAIATLVAIALWLPLRVRFELSRGPMEALAAELARPDAPKMIEKKVVGLFDAEWIEPFDGGYRFLIEGTGFLNPYGFAYSPNGPPPDIGGEDYYEHFSGPWWIWEEDW